MQDNSFVVKSSDMIYLAKEKIDTKDDEKLLKILDALDDDDDINNIYTNANI